MKTFVPEPVFEQVVTLVGSVTMLEAQFELDLMVSLVAVTHVL